MHNGLATHDTPTKVTNGVVGDDSKMTEGRNLKGRDRVRVTSFEILHRQT